MKKKIFVYMLTLCLIVACSFALTACSDKHSISITQNDYFEISTSVSTAKSDEKVTISYTKKENFVEKPGYEVKLMVQTNDQKTIVVNYDESGNYYFIMPDCDVSINAEYLPIQYTITYDLNGGENNANNPTTYTVDSNDIIISQPTYTNYYFSGWTINDGSQIVRDYTIPSGTTGNIILKANWKEIVGVYSYSTTYTYSGEELSVNASNFVGSNMTQFVEISGDTKATNAGTYNVTLSLKDKENYCWEDGTTEAKTATWEIVKAKFTVTRPSYKRYSGEEISVTSEDFTGSRLAELVDLTGTTSATNAGTYNVTLSLKDKANTTWEDGTTEDKITTWEIEKRIIELQNRKYEIYSGEEISVTNNNFVVYSRYANLVDLTGTTSATNVGTYNVTLSLKDKANTTWEDGTTEDKTTTWEIVKRRIEIKNKYSRKTTYSGDEIFAYDLVLYSSDVDFVDITGTVSATNAGVYEITLSLKDKENTIWSDKTTEDKTATWEIKSYKITLKKPYYAYAPYHYSTEYSSTDYRGNEQSIKPNYFVDSEDIKFIDITGTTSATNAGIYNITLALKDKLNYRWNDGTTEDKTAQWRITPIKVSIDLPVTKEYTGSSIRVGNFDFADYKNYHFFNCYSYDSSLVGTHYATLSLKDKENTTWDDGTTDDITVPWSIIPARVSLDTPVTKNYTGNVITVTPADFVYLKKYSDLFTISGTTSATELGTYNVTLSLKNKESATWEDGTTEDKTAQWCIAPAKISFRTRVDKEYTSDVITITPADFGGRSDLFTISGTTSATDAGTYNVTLSLIDKEKTTWEDGTTEDKTAQWRIVPAEVSLNTPVAKEYTGDIITITPADFSQKYSNLFTISGTTYATDVGTYNVTLSLIDKKNRTWKDGTTDDKTVQWRIVLAKVSINALDKEYTGDVITITPADFNQKYSDLFTISGTTSATEVGSYFVTISLKDKENTTWYNGNTNERTVRWDIVPVKVSVDLHIAKEYTGDKITITDADLADLENSNLFTVWTTSSATKVGTYTATLSLKNRINYCWEDGTTWDKTIQWSIVPAKVSVNLPAHKEYTGDIITITPADFADLENSNLFTISGTTSATDAGTYEVTLSLKDKVNYCWKGGNSDDITASWNILKCVSVNQPAHKEYTGDVITITPADFADLENNNLFTISGGTASATNVGTYNVTLSLKDKANYRWKDGTTEDKNVTWEIGKKSIHYLLDYKFGKYSGKELSVTSEYFTGSSLAELVDVTGTTNATYPGVYNVTLSLKDKVNYCWEDGTTEDKNATWEIQKRIIYLQSYKWETYSGEELSAYNVVVADSHAVDFVNITGSASATNVGVYEITLSLKDKENTIWSDGTTEDKNATWEIKKRKIATLDQFETIYTGDEVVLKNTYFIANINDSKFITLLGTTKATEVGTYDVILSLIDKANTTWEDGTTEDKTISWEIKTPSEVTLKNEKTEKVYTGSEISVTSKDFVKFSPIAVEISGTTSATNVGTYNVTLSLKDKANTTWEDGTTDDKTVTWEIVKAKLTVTRYTPLYTGEEKIVTSVNLIAEDEYADFVTVSGQTSATEPGAYTVTLSLNDKINMTWSDGTTDDKTVKWKIQRLDWKNNVAVSAFVKKIYTGEEITVTSADFILAEEYADYITISGQTSGTEKGTYTVTISLADKENMTWDDDTTEDKTVQWVIAD